MQNEISSMQIDTTGDKNKSQLKQVKFDNLYDVLFNDAGMPKENLSKTLLFTGDKLDFLESQG
jgi:hypothetical protein